MNSFSGSLQSTTDSSGQASFTVQEIPSQATFTAALEGFRQDNPVAGSSQRIESNLVEIVLKPSSSIQPRQGTLRVTVVDEAGEEVSSAKVTLINAVTQGERAKSSGSDGRAEFDGIDFGFRYYVKAEATGFTTFVDSGSRVFSEEGTLVRVELEKKREEKKEDEMKIAVREKGGAFVQEAEVNLFVGGKLLAHELSDSKGVAAIPASKDHAYYATVFKQGFLPKILSNLRAGDSKEVVFSMSR